jgi:ribulose kinase
VVQGGSDAFIGVIGLRRHRPGEMALITGSSHLHIGVAEPVQGGRVRHHMDGVYPGKPIIEGGQTSTGSVIAWFKRHFAEHTSFEALNEGAAVVPPGAEGLLVLDHFQGNRTPYTDALSRGAITGLTLKHTPAHVFRAIIEGICLGTRLIIDNFGEAFSAKRIVLAGGATNSPLWLKIHADTIGAPIELTEVADAPALGCAILAAHGAGKFKTIEEGCRAMVRRKSAIEPDLKATRFYETEMLRVMPGMARSRASGRQRLEVGFDLARLASRRAAATGFAQTIQGSSVAKPGRRWRSRRECRWARGNQALEPEAVDRAARGNAHLLQALGPGGIIALGMLKAT